MRYALFFILTCCCFAFTNKPCNDKLISPLSKYSPEWDKPEYKVCNTAAGAGYMTEEEKKVIYILNMARMNPKLFCKTVVKKHPSFSANNEYCQSLVEKLNSIKKMNVLQPDQTCYASAQCHAYSSGLKGYTGHDRLTDSCMNKKSFNGECCDYGHSEALAIVMSFLIDNDVPSLGHREICFMSYKKIGVSIEPHSVWRHNAVLDFRY